jgi:collagenase-like PrtC family protease
MPAQSRAQNRPEVLAPAGSHEALRAALAHGADSVYFGLQEGFNARARAENFSLANLKETVLEVHRAGARAYVTLNTLVFEPELEHVERIVRAVAEAGVDALIVQDPAVCLLAHEICPRLELHASTQMTIASPKAARLAELLHVTRVVVPRELSVEEIRKFRAGTDLELEVFIHGALCVSWSGQCLTSEAWGGRSANRGQCSQECRMPYELVVDGEPRALPDLRYLLSPRDLAGVRAVPELLALGVHGLKIEGRQKSPQYVATSVFRATRTLGRRARRGWRRKQAERRLARRPARDGAQLLARSSRAASSPVPTTRPSSRAASRNTAASTSGASRVCSSAPCSCARRHAAGPDLGTAGTRGQARHGTSSSTRATPSRRTSPAGRSGRSRGAAGARARLRRARAGPRAAAGRRPRLDH